MPDVIFNLGLQWHAICIIPFGSEWGYFVRIRLHDRENSRKKFSTPCHTVDSSEIQLSPVEVGSLSNYLHGLINIPGGCLEF